jgi:hypothetical protein
LGERRFAVAAAALSVLDASTAAPFATIQPQRVEAYIPADEAALVIIV